VDIADFVIKALSDPDADPQAATALLVQLRDTETTRIEKAKTERAAKIAGLQNEIDALERQQVAPADDDDLEQRAADRQQASKEKFAKRKAEQDARFAKAMQLVEQGQYEAANAVLDGAEV
jgi:hypothetical protein